MANVPFVSSKSSYLQLKATGGTVMCLKVIGGTGYTIGDNDVNEDLGAGSIIAAPLNINTGLYTPVLDVVCRLFAPSGGAGWYSAANIQAMFGTAAATATDLKTRDNANGDTPYLDAKFYNGLDSVQDQVKLARFSIEASSASNDIVARMTFLGLGSASATIFGNFVDSTGAPKYWKDCSFTGWTPAGGVAATPYGIERYSLGISTGLSYGKFADGTDLPSTLDPAATIAGGVSIVQRSGAEGLARLLSTRNGVLAATIGGVIFTTGLNRQGRGYVANPGGGLVDRTAWQLAYVNTTFATVAAA